MFPVSTCIFSLLDTSIRLHISDSKKSKNSILSDESPNDLLISSNFSFFPPIKNSNSNGIEFLSIFDKNYVKFSISALFFSSSFFSFINSSSLGKSLLSCSDKFVPLMSAFFVFGITSILFSLESIIFVKGLEK